MNRVYQVITDRIVELLEQGRVPWHCPWRGPEGAPKNLVSGKDYRGINALVLASAGFSSPWWLTFKQARQRGGHVNKGEKGFPCVYWNRYDAAAPDAEPTTARRSSSRPFLRYYTVFNSEQCSGIETPDPPELRAEVSPIEGCEAIVTGMSIPPRIVHRGIEASYCPATDTIELPPRDRFDSPEAYYSTLFHEVLHSTGHQSRLARSGITENPKFGSKLYSREELIAEIGSAYLCANAGIEKTLENSASYIQSWLTRLRADSKLIVHAAGQAQRGVEFITLAAGAP